MSSDADTSSERKTDVSTASTPRPKRTRTENETEKGAEIKAETEGVKEMSETVDAAAAQSAVRGASALRGMAGPIASAAGVRETSP